MNEKDKTASRDRNPWKWFVAVILALVSHGVWFFWLNIAWPVPRSTVPEAPRWSLLKLSGDFVDHPIAEVLNVWSPSTFALPSSRGFSRPLVIEEIRIRPPIENPTEISMMMDRRSVRSDASPAISLLEWEQLRTQLDAEPLRVPTPERMDTAEWQDLPPIPRVEHMEGVTDRVVERVAFEGDETVWGMSPWIADLVLTVDEWGSVVRVMMDQRVSDEGINHELVRAVYRWRWKPAESSDTANIRIVYHGLSGAGTQNMGETK